MEASQLMFYIAAFAAGMLAGFVAHWFFTGRTSEMTVKKDKPLPLSRWCRSGDYVYVDTYTGRWKSLSPLFMTWYRPDSGERMELDVFDDLEARLCDFLTHADPALLRAMQVRPEEMDV